MPALTLIWLGKTPEASCSASESCSCVVVSRIDHQCFCIPYIGQVRSKLQCIDEGSCFFFSAFNAKLQYTTESIVQVFFTKCMIAGCSPGRDTIQIQPVDGPPAIWPVQVHSGRAFQPAAKVFPVPVTTGKN